MFLRTHTLTQMTKYAMRIWSQQWVDCIWAHFAQRKYGKANNHKTMNHWNARWRAIEKLNANERIPLNCRPSYRSRPDSNKMKLNFYRKCHFVEINSFFCAGMWCISFNKDAHPVRPKCVSYWMCRFCVYVCVRQCVCIDIRPSWIYFKGAFAKQKSVCRRKMHLSIDGTYNKCFNPGYRLSKVENSGAVWAYHCAWSPMCFIGEKREIIKW